MLLRIESGIEKLIPGITGWAQVNGRDEVTINEKVMFEKQYLEKRTFLFDMKIIIKTITNVLKKKGVSH